MIARPFLPHWKWKKKPVWATTPVKMDGNSFIFCIFYSPKTQHKVLRQGRAVGIPTVFSQSNLEEEMMTHWTSRHWRDLPAWRLWRSVLWVQTCASAVWVVPSGNRCWQRTGMKVKTHNCHCCVWKTADLPCMCFNLPAFTAQSAGAWAQRQRVLGSSPGCRPKRTPSEHYWDVLVKEPVWGIVHTTTVRKASCVCSKRKNSV